MPDKNNNWTYNDINSIVNYKQLEMLQMFKYTGLPETIPAYMLELMLQINGHCFITDKMPNDTNLRCYTDAWGDNYA